MIGPRAGVRVGAKVGLAGGPGEDPIGSLGIAVTRDATSNIYTPVSSTEWATFRAAFGLSVATPDSLWLLNESSGNPADTIGSLPLTAAGTVTYQQAASGWTRTGVGLTDGVNSQFATTAAGLPNANAASQTVMIIATATTASAGNRQVYVGPNNSLRIIGGTPRFSVTAIASTASGAVSPMNAVRPWIYKHDFTNSTQTGYTDQEALTIAFTAIAGKALRIGSTSVSFGGVALYACAWYNANAEISDANIRSLLQAMGFSVAW